MKTKNRTTTFKSINPTEGLTQVVSEAFSSTATWKRRGLIDRIFAGAIVCAKDDNTASVTAKLYYVDSSASYLMDATSLSAGESAVWTEEDYGLALKKSEYVKLVIGGDEANCWITTYDTYL